MQLTTRSLQTPSGGFFHPSAASGRAAASLLKPASSWVLPVASRRHVLRCRLRLRCELQQQAVEEFISNSRSKGDSINLEMKERIKERLANVRLLSSAFDTAWVAMVPSPCSPLIPCFPGCLDWVQNNQKLDGSWNINEGCKDALLSTLACILALKQWNIGQEKIQSGIEYIQHNSSFLVDKSQHTPIGFNVVFTMMIHYGRKLGLNVPISEEIENAMLRVCDIEIQSDIISAQWKSSLSFLVEGIDSSHDYNELKTYQKRNGSLFNSPSATAVLLILTQDTKAMDYLQSVVHEFGNAVPMLYPSNMYARLSTVDTLEKLGIGHHFSDYLENVLAETYRSWLQEDEELYTEISTHAIAFRLLRIHGYDISSEIFALIHGDELLSYKWNSFPKIATTLELYKASLLEACRDDHAMKNLNHWSTQILKQYTSNFIVDNDLERHIIHEVNQNLEFPFHESLARLEHKRNIENYKFSIIQCLKSPSMLHNINGVDILKFAADDFNFCQSIYQKELHMFQRWVKEQKLDTFVRVDLRTIFYCYFTAAATIYPPELFEARMAWSKNSLLTTVVDDFFDVTGSEEEQVNFVELCIRWESNYKSQCISEKVYIIFESVYTTTNELCRKATLIHGYSTTSHLAEVWVDMVKTMKKEAEWMENGTIPTIEEYMKNGYVSFALGPIVQSTAYFVNQKISWDIVRSEEYQQLFEFMSNIGRLTNDIQGFEREAKEKTLNIVSLKILNGDGIISIEDVQKEAWKMIDNNRDKLLDLVLRTNGSVVPRPCKDLFWNMCCILYTFYKNIDGYRNSDLMVVVKSIINEPINVCN